MESIKEWNELCQKWTTKHEAELGGRERSFDIYLDLLCAESAIRYGYPFDSIRTTSVKEK